MQLRIGDNIKALRKSRSLTQERFAEAIGVSFQAVSKWENHITLPDITLIPSIADYFGVSTDELFGYDRKEKDKAIEAICDEAYRYRESDPAKGRELIEAGLAAYPDNDILLNHLLYVLNYTEKPDETIAVASKLTDTTDQSEVKYDALRFLAYAYNAKGDMESALTALEQIPEIYFNRLTETAFVLQGRPKREAAEKQKWISFETLLQMMWKLTECYEADGEPAKALVEIDRGLALIAVLADDAAEGAFTPYAAYFTKQRQRIAAASEK